MFIRADQPAWPDNKQLLQLAWFRGSATNIARAREEAASLHSLATLEIS